MSFAAHSMRRSGHRTTSNDGRCPRDARCGIALDHPTSAVRRILHADGLRYRVSIRPLPELRRTADVVFTRAHIAVFIDGCFWHGCPEHYQRPAAHRDYWDEKVRRNKERDAETDARLADAGWLVIRRWEHESAVEVARQVEERWRAAAVRTFHEAGSLD